MLPDACNHRSIRRDFRSSDPGEVIDFAGRTLAPHRMDVLRRGKMAAEFRCFEMAPAKIVDLHYGAEVWIEGVELQAHYFVHASVAGSSTIWSGVKSHVMHPGNILVSSPGQPMRIHISPESRHVTVRLSRDSLEDHLTTNMKLRLNQALHFNPQQDDQSLAQAWRNFLAHLMQQASDFPEVLTNPRLQRHYATIMAEMLLSRCEHSYSDQVRLVGNDITPWHVRRARDIIHDQLVEPISVTDLATEVGVSVRSLQSGFRKFLGLKPVEYIRRCRLEKLHESLIHCDDDNNVTKIMLDCGIMNFGRYAQYYRQQYGCRPSDTMRNRN
jgi:AraC-like DNA-binding protein/plasmid maintenance system antidote protein VapI